MIEIQRQKSMEYVHSMGGWGGLLTGGEVHD